MTDEIKPDNDLPVPSLTLEPNLDESGAIELVEETTVETEPAPKAELDESALSPEEKTMVENFSQQIDLSDSNMIVQYGAGAQKKMADFSESALKSVRTQELGEVGALLTEVVGELKNFDAEDEKGIFGFFKRGVNKVQALRVKYDKAEKNVERVVKALKDNQMRLMKDNATLDKMYDMNIVYFKELTMYILAGKKKLAEVQNTELPALVAKAEETGRPEDAQAARDLEERIVRFERKLSDLELTRVIAMQTAPQIRMVQNNEIAMIEKIQTTLVNTIPLWKNQMVLSLGIANAADAVKAQNAVNKTTNELLRKNADMLQSSTTQIAEETERGIVDIETLQHTNETLIQTFDDVLRIQQEGRQKRAAAEVEIRRLEDELKSKLLEMQNKPVVS
ncbi:MAG: toxic anion resistance protein [Eggerthella sp.]|nr:toxic anion resistance protein [Eggerthella sp.]